MVWKRLCMVLSDKELSKMSLKDIFKYLDTLDLEELEQLEKPKIYVNSINYNFISDIPKIFEINIDKIS